MVKYRIFGVFILILIFQSDLCLFAQKTTQISPGNIVFISDTQAPLWFESIYLKDNHNTEATRAILNDIPNQKPLSVNFIGDVVNMGCNNKRWRLIDSSLVKLHAAGYSTHACLGNHELMRNKKEGEFLFLII